MLNYLFFVFMVNFLFRFLIFLLWKIYLRCLVIFKIDFFVGMVVGVYDVGFVRMFFFLVIIVEVEIVLDVSLYFFCGVFVGNVVWWFGWVGDCSGFGFGVIGLWRGGYCCKSMRELGMLNW